MSFIFYFSALYLPAFLSLSLCPTLISIGGGEFIIVMTYYISIYLSFIMCGADFLSIFSRLVRMYMLCCF